MNYKQDLFQRIRRGALGVRVCSGIVVAISSAACAPPSNPTHQTVDYYRANREAREAKLAECANDPGTLRNTPDCVNARQAGNLESVGSQRDLPPLELSTERNQPGPSLSVDATDDSERADRKDGPEEVR